MAKAHLQDLDNYKKGTCWTSSRISSELDNEFAGSFKELSFKTERTDDHGLRNDISILRRKMAGCLTADTYKAGQGRLISFIQKFETVMRKLGVVLRGNY